MLPIVEVKQLKVQLEFLIGLQGCDTETRSIKGRKGEGPAKIKTLEHGLKVIEEQLDEEASHLEECKRERRGIEQDIEILESSMKKSNIKLSYIKSNKEYKAVLKENDGLKTQKALFEDRVIEIMEEIETLEKRHVVNKAKEEKFKEEFEKDHNEILREQKILDQELKKLEESRTRFCQAVDDNLLRRYNFLMEYKDGLAISPVIKGVCQACHLGIPPQQFNELIRGDELMSCPNCTRIIYWGEDKRFQVSLENSGQTSKT